MNNINQLRAKYLSENPLFEKQLIELESKLQKCIRNPNFMGNDPINFTSWLSEMKCGFYLDKLGFDLLYDEPITFLNSITQKPDWICKKEEITYIVEVFRINKPNDQMLGNIHNFQNSEKKTNQINVENELVNDNTFKKLLQKIKVKRDSYLELSKNLGYPLIIFIDCSTKWEIGIEEFEIILSDMNSENKWIHDDISGLIVLDHFKQYHFRENRSSKRQVRSEHFYNPTVRLLQSRTTD